jgi:very-short-patch-repair endonuclease
MPPTPKRECEIAARSEAKRLQIPAASPFQNFILDFICFDRRLVIEVDGSQHFDSKRDQQRDAILARQGFRVLRY